MTAPRIVRLFGDGGRPTALAIVVDGSWVALEVRCDRLHAWGVDGDWLDDSLRLDDLAALTPDLRRGLRERGAEAAVRLGISAHAALLLHSSLEAHT